MLLLVLKKLKEKKYIILSSLFFIIFMIIYTLIDSFNLSYSEMIKQFGLYLVIINILVNLIMSSLSAFMMSLSTAFYKLSGKEGKGSIFGSFSILFGILTYGCTSCVIAFFATIGITFSVAVLPLAGLPYKTISLIIVILGLLWLLREIKNNKCLIKK